jgi:4-alpha-glucanotransferase
VTTKHAGVNLPLFSARSTTGWGIGELPDLVPLAHWLSAAGFDRVMLLPLGTMEDGQSSPYSATSTLAIDPLFISLAALPDFALAGGEARLSPLARESLELARCAGTVRYDLVRRAKADALARAFDAFAGHEWEQLTPRAATLAAYIARERWWLDDYALFQALAETMPGVPWRAWPAALRDREPAALDDLRRQLARDVLRHQYWQWVAETQWQDARAAARALGVEVFGDLPFVANAHSPEVWARPGEFRLDLSVGVPPDAFSDEGQDWGLPAYHWDAIRSTDYAWIAQRAGRMAALYDGIRVDHVIGLFRTYCRPADGDPFFSPGDEPEQRAQGRRVLTRLGESGVRIIAEDLGLVPDFLREVLAELSVPGCRVLRWERRWREPGAPFIDPRTYPVDSAAMTGTHDTETVVTWWDDLSREDRHALLALAASAGAADARPRVDWSPAVRDALLGLMYRAGSRELFLPVQDLFGWPDRINVPGTIGDANWSWALPWPVDTLDVQPEAVERRDALAALARASGRAPATD